MVVSDGSTIGPRLTSGATSIIGNLKMGSQEVVRSGIVPWR
jgi:hypothetical protein